MVALFLSKRHVVLYVGVISLCALAAGFLLEWFYLKLGKRNCMYRDSKRIAPEDLRVGVAVLLPLLMDLWNLLQRKRM